MQIQHTSQWETLYRGSVKDVLTPVSRGADQGPAKSLLFQYTDSFSVFDWGRMPDGLPHKGEALAILGAHFFEKIERLASWQEFSRSPEAHQLRKWNRFGSDFIEWGEKLQTQGLRTHYLGVAKASRPNQPPDQTVFLPNLTEPTRWVSVLPIAVVRPQAAKIMGRAVMDYSASRDVRGARLVPLEFVFRFECPKGSSLPERTVRNPDYWPTFVLGGTPLPEGSTQVCEGARFEFPTVELFTKLESTDRPVSLPEALSISGLSASALQEIIFKTVWMAGFLKWELANSKLELLDGKLEWAVHPDGSCMLVDAIGPDELRIRKNGKALSKEFLRSFYRQTPWYAKLQKAKSDAALQGTQDWKRFVNETPPSLSNEVRELGSQLYQALAEEITGRKWWKESWNLEQWLEKMDAWEKSQAGETGVSGT